MSKEAITLELTLRKLEAANKEVFDLEKKVVAMNGKYNELEQRYLKQVELNSVFQEKAGKFDIIRKNFKLDETLNRFVAKTDEDK